MAILAKHGTLQKTFDSLQPSSKKVIHWGSAQGVIFIPEKAEQRLSQRRKDRDPSLILSISFRNLIVSENMTHKYIGWLGVYLYILFSYFY